MLGHMVRLHSWRISLEADPRHRNMIMEHFGLTEDSKTLAKQGYKEEVITEEELAMEQLNVEEQRTYRISGAALLLLLLLRTTRASNFLPKGSCRSMSCPTLRDFQRSALLSWSEDRAIKLSVAVGRRGEPDAVVCGQ